MVTLFYIIGSVCLAGGLLLALAAWVIGFFSPLSILVWSLLASLLWFACGKHLDNQKETVRLLKKLAGESEEAPQQKPGISPKGIFAPIKDDSAEQPPEE